MFDMATMPQPASAGHALQLVVPFDLRLAQPGPAVPYPYTEWVTPDAEPAPGVQVLQTFAVCLEGGLHTAVVLSLFTDRRAGPDDLLPLGQTDRRGWLGDAYMPLDDAGAEGDEWGSRLWLLYTGKAVANVLERAQFWAREALAWMVRAGIASRVEATAEWVGQRQDRLAIRPTIYQPGQQRPVYDVLWGTSLTRGSWA